MPRFQGKEVNMDLKIVINIKGDRVTIGVQAPNTDPVLETARRRHSLRYLPLSAKCSTLLGPGA